MVICMSNSRRERIKQLIKDSKVECINCGEKDKEKLTFHHVDKSQKLFEIADGPRYTYGAVVKEIAKCEVICRDCHDIEDGNVKKEGKSSWKKKTSAEKNRKRKEAMKRRKALLYKEAE